MVFFFKKKKKTLHCTFPGGRLDAMPSFCPQLYADGLKCSSVCPRCLFGAARFTVQYVRVVGQDVSPRKCVFLSTSKSVRKSVKVWDVSGDGRLWWTFGLQLAG